MLPTLTHNRMLNYPRSIEESLYLDYYYYYYVVAVVHFKVKNSFRWKIDPGVKPCSEETYQPSHLTDANFCDFFKSFIWHVRIQTENGNLRN